MSLSCPPAEHSRCNQVSLVGRMIQWLITVQSERQRFSRWPRASHATKPQARLSLHARGPIYGQSHGVALAGTHTRQRPHQCRPSGPCRSHAVSCFHSANETTCPVQVRGLPVVLRPCRKASALVSHGPKGIEEGGAARRSLGAFSSCPTPDKTDETDKTSSLAPQSAVTINRSEHLVSSTGSVGFVPGHPAFMAAASHRVILASDVAQG